MASPARIARFLRLCILTALGVALVNATSAKATFKLLPALGYSTDEGLSLGLRADVNLYGRDSIKYATLGAQTSFSTQGQQDHYLLVDLPAAFRIGARSVRATAKIAFARSLYESYYGGGNETEPDESMREDHAYAYERREPYVKALAGLPLVTRGSTSVRLSLGVSAEYDWILQSQRLPSTGADPLLFQDRPLGIDGGALWGPLGALTVDSRDSPDDPSRGIHAGVLVHAVPAMLGNDFDFVQADLFECGYIPLGRDVVLAERLLVDGMTHGAPFFREDRIMIDDPGEGIVFAGAIGGRSSVKGIEASRYTGNLKLIANAEIRWYFWHFSLFRDPSKLGAAVSIDAGRACEHASEVSFTGFHITYGAGLRLVWGDFVVGADAGFYESPVPRVYVTTGHPF